MKSLVVLTNSLEIAQRFIPPEEMQAYGMAIRRHPVIRALEARMRGEPQVVDQDGEPVSETQDP